MITLLYFFGAIGKPHYMNASWASSSIISIWFSTEVLKQYGNLWALTNWMSCFERTLESNVCVSVSQPGLPWAWFYVELLSSEVGGFWHWTSYCDGHDIYLHLFIYHAFPYQLVPKVCGFIFAEALIKSGLRSQFLSQSVLSFPVRGCWV